MSRLPTGTVTLLFTDVEGSTRLLRELGEDGYAEALRAHRRALRAACERHSGVEVDSQGDSLFVAFARASDAVAAAEDAQGQLEGTRLPARMGLHTGAPQLLDGGYVGIDVHVAARICAAGHGGQVLLSQTTRDLIDAEVSDLGDHRLKDLGEPVRIYQLGRHDFGSPRTATAGSIPVPPTPLLGRKRELAELHRLLRSEKARLITLTGPGGIGKTRLAVALAGELVEHYPDGVWFVDLSALRDPRLVLATIGSALGAHDLLEEYLVQQEVLLVLDNLEQIVEAAPDVGALLARCPGITILATSREPLRLAGEREYPLRLLGESPAIELFRQRAESVDPSFDASYEVLRRLSRRLDRLPLALELAAARTRTFTAEALLGRLDQALPLLTRGTRDLPERQRALAATIAWSYDLLSSEEQQLFRRLGVFAGGCTLEVAEAVCDADLDALTSIVEKSLVRRVDSRFAMLETIREFARARLEDSGEAEGVAERHAAWILRLAEDADEEIETEKTLVEEHPGEDWFARLDEDYANVRAALRFLLDRRDCARAARLGFAVRAYWLRRDRAPEGMRWMEEALACLDRDDATVQARALYALGQLSFFADRPEVAERAFHELLDLGAGVDDSRLRPAAYTGLGNVARARGDLDGARRLFEQGLGLVREQDDRAAIYYHHHLLGELARDAGELREAEHLLTTALQQARTLRQPGAEANTVHSLADLALDEGDLASAKQRYVQALELFVEMQSTRSVAYCFAGLACVAAREGRCSRAGRLWGAVERIEESEGARMLGYERERYEREIETIGGKEFAAAVAEGRRLGLEEAVDEALADA